MIRKKERPSLRRKNGKYVSTLSTIGLIFLGVLRPWLCQCEFPIEDELIQPKEPRSRPQDRMPLPLRDPLGRACRLSWEFGCYLVSKLLSLPWDGRSWTYPLLSGLSTSPHPYYQRKNHLTHLLFRQITEPRKESLQVNRNPAKKQSSVWSWNRWDPFVHS